MTASEQELRAALDGTLSVDRFLHVMLAKFEELKFLTDDPAVRRASLRGKQQNGTGSMAVYFSPGGRILKIVALFDEQFSTTVTYRLPREHWPKGA
jgi:hypothetical protein